MCKAILLVEDSSAERDLAMMAFERDDLTEQVQITTDGEEALDYLFCQGNYASRKKENPSIVLLDLHLPKVDGIQVLKTIKLHESFKTIPVIMLSNSNDYKDVEQCYKLGANAYLLKPVDFFDFQKMIREVTAFWGWLNEPPPGGHRFKQHKMTASISSHT